MSATAGIVAARPFRLGGSGRPQGGTLSRFVGTAAHADRAAAALAADHPAVREARTLFPSRVFAADAVPRVLVGGHNSAKIGAVIRKGPWRGFPVVTLTLEERATCPASCTLWRECYGNAMPLARRHQAGPALVARLDAELRALAAAHPRGFAVRLHVLGDFHSTDYLAAWVGWMAAIPALHVWGYTAHGRDTPIGRIVAEANEFWPGRWAVRFSGPAGGAGPMRVTTIWRQPEAAVVPEGLVCPAQTHATAACATCGLCWAPAMADRPIAFIGHGKNVRGDRKSRETAMQTSESPAGLSPEAIAAWLRAQVQQGVAAEGAARREAAFGEGWRAGWRAAMQRIVALAGEHAPVPPEVGDAAPLPVPTMAASLAAMARAEDQDSRQDSGGGTALPSIPQGPEGESAGIGAPESAAGGSGESGGVAADDAPSPPPAAQREAQTSPAAEREAEQTSPAAQREAQPSPPPAAAVKWSAQRIVRLRELWPGELSEGGIARELNRLEGPPITPGQVGAYAHAMLRLGARAAARAARQDSERAAGHAPAAASPPVSAAPGAPGGATPAAASPAPPPAKARAAGGFRLGEAHGDVPMQADWTAVEQWAASVGIAFDGDMAPVNAVRARRKLPQFVLVDYPAYRAA